MQVPLSSSPNSALPSLVRREAADALLRAAGLMIVTPQGEALFLRYAPDHDHAGEWAWPAGGLEGDEEPEDTAKRETREETGWIPNEALKEVDNSQDEIDFTTFATTTGNQFIPELSDEHDSWCWAPLTNPPEPLHPGAAKTLKSLVDTDEVMDAVGQDDAWDIKWEEGEHPRDNSGKFTSGGGSSGSVRPPDDQDVSAIGEYSSALGSSYVNRALRGQEADLPKWQKEAAKKLIPKLDRAFEAASPLQKDTKLFRGVRSESIDPSNLSQYVGKSFTDDGFVSTSTSKKIASKFASNPNVRNKYEGVLFHVNVPKGVRVLDIQKGTVASEKEKVLPRGGRFVVRSVSQGSEDSPGIMEVDYIPKEEGAKDVVGKDQKLSIKEKREANEHEFQMVRFRNKLKNVGEPQEKFAPPYPEAWGENRHPNRAKDQKIVHPNAANIASRAELNSIGLPHEKPHETRAINVAFAHGGTTGPEAKQSKQANRYIDSGDLTEHDRERTGKSKAVLGRDADIRWSVPIVSKTGGGTKFKEVAANTEEEAYRIVQKQLGVGSGFKIDRGRGVTKISGDAVKKEASKGRFFDAKPDEIEWEVKLYEDPQRRTKANPFIVKARTAEEAKAKADKHGYYVGAVTRLAKDAEYVEVGDAKEDLIGKFVVFTQPTVYYEKGQPKTGTSKLRGKVTRILPNGKLEVKSQQHGYFELSESEIANDAEYVEKPHLGRLPPREAERLSRDSELTESQRAWARKKLGASASEEEMRKAVEEANKDRLNYTSAGATRKAKDDKETKEETNYIDGPVDTEPCKHCTMFQSPRGCSAVTGDISPTGHCDLFEAATAEDAIAFDEGSVRTTDPDGRLHVATTNISKAVVNPYKGSEIPDYEKLGLEPDKIYHLYRDPDELAKAAPTFNNLPLLKEHVPITADTHKPELVIGSTGTDASFESPYLKNSLVLWSKDGITDVESNKKKELSSAYRYTADMTPGTWEDPETGERKNFDGVMRNIVGNHVALVKEGRAGHDVVVGDSKAGLVAGRKRKRRVMGSMTKVAANTALMLSAYIRPKLAQDQNVNLLPAVEGLTAKNFDERRSRIIREVRKLTKGKLANDASIGEIAEVLDLLEAHPDTGEDAPVTDVQEAMMSEMTDVPGTSNVSGQGSPGGDRRARDRRARDNYADDRRGARDRRRARDAFPPKEEDREEEREGEDRHARDADPTAAVESFLKDKVSGSDLQHVCNLMRGGATEDDNPGGDTEPHAEGEEHLEDLGAAHGAEDDPMSPEEKSDIGRSREWHVGAGEPPPGGGGHTGETVQDRHAYDRRGAKDRRAKDRKRAHDQPPPFKGMPEVGKGPMDKRAMDAAIKVSVEQAIKNQQQIRQAERDVRPWVGELAMDSATCPEDVYAAALKARNIKIDGVHPSAYSVILKNLPLPGQGANRGSTTARVAMDSASRSSFNERFPNVGRIGLL